MQEKEIIQALNACCGNSGSCFRCRYQRKSTENNERICVSSLLEDSLVLIEAQNDIIDALTTENLTNHYESIPTNERGRLPAKKKAIGYICPSCSGSVKLSDNFCRRCGQPITNPLRKDSENAE